MTQAQTILVTGGAGFVGANLVLHLAQHDHRVVALDLSAPPPLVERYWQPARENIFFEAGNVTDAAQLTDIAARHAPDSIVHAAVVTAVDPLSERQMATRLVEVNLMGTLRLLDLARQIGARRFVYISSSGVYAPVQSFEPLSETTPLRANSDLYTITKRVSEELCARYQELFDLDVVVGRLNGPYGPMERDTGVRPILSPIFQLARAALTRGHVRVRDANPSFDWTYTQDLAAAIRLLVEMESLSYSVYNLSNGQARPFNDVMRLLTELIPSSHFERVGADQAGDFDPSYIPTRGPLDISRLSRDVGFVPAYDLERGLAAALPWWRAIVQAGG